MSFFFDAIVSNLNNFFFKKKTTDEDGNTLY